MEYILTVLISVVGGTAIGVSIATAIAPRTDNEFETVLYGALFGCGAGVALSLAIIGVLL